MRVTSTVLIDVDDVALGHETKPRWNPRESWIKAEGRAKWIMYESVSQWQHKPKPNRGRCYRRRSHWPRADHRRRSTIDAYAVQADRGVPPC
jgi:hypothetical protein